MISMLPKMIILYVIAPYPGTITPIHGVEFAIREPDSFHCCSCRLHVLLDMHNHCLLLLYVVAPADWTLRCCWSMSHPCLLLLIHYTLVYLFKKYIWLNTLEAWLLAQGKWINNNLKLRQTVGKRSGWRRGLERRRTLRAKQRNRPW